MPAWERGAPAGASLRAGQDRAVWAWAAATKRRLLPFLRGLQRFGFRNDRVPCCTGTPRPANVRSGAIKARLSHKLGLTLGASCRRAGGAVLCCAVRGAASTAAPEGRGPGRATPARPLPWREGGVPPLPWWRGAPVGSSVAAGGAGRGDASGHAVASARERGEEAAGWQRPPPSRVGRRPAPRRPGGAGRGVLRGCHGVAGAGAAAPPLSRCQAGAVTSGGGGGTGRDGAPPTQRPVTAAEASGREMAAGGVLRPPQRPPRGLRRWGSPPNALLGRAGGGGRAGRRRRRPLRCGAGSHRPSRRAGGRGEVWNRPPAPVVGWVPPGRSPASLGGGWRVSSSWCHFRVSKCGVCVGQGERWIYRCQLHLSRWRLWIGGPLVPCETVGSASCLATNVKVNDDTWWFVEKTRSFSLLKFGNGCSPACCVRSDVRWLADCLVSCVLITTSSALFHLHLSPILFPGYPCSPLNSWLNFLTFPEVFLWLCFNDGLYYALPCGRRARVVL